MSIRLGSDLLAGKSSGALPSQSGQAGKFLTTNGSVASWGTVAGANADNLSITTSASDKLQTVGVLNQSNTSTALKLWTGTKAQYDAIATKDQNTLYNITDDAVDTKVSHNIGDIFFSLRSESAINGAVVCDGSSYNISDYSAGAQSIKNLLDGGKLPYVSITDFDAMVTAKGSCRCFGYDGGSTFKVPKLNNVFVEAGSAATPSEFIDAGLPNISGSVRGTNRTDTGETTDGFKDFSGAFYNSGTLTHNVTATASGSYQTNGLGFDASRSSSIYGNSNTVQPNAVKYRAFIQLTNTTSDSALQDISSLMNQMKETVNYDNITNCITEIPQDIHVELSNNGYILKAGSVVYMPNGFEQDGTTPHFDKFVCQQDLSYVPTWGAGYRSFLNGRINANGELASINMVREDYFASGDTAPTSPPTSMTWYDTATNKIKTYRDGVWKTDAVDEPRLLPFGIVTVTTGNVISSIDQVFNGFGYFASTVFVLPGVKGLIPNGRNDDGTLKNQEFTFSQVTIRLLATNEASIYCFLGTNGIFGWGVYQYFESEKKPVLQTGQTYCRWLDTKNNYMYWTNDGGTTWNKSEDIFLGYLKKESNQNISQFSPRKVYQSVDYSGADFVVAYKRPTSSDQSWYRLYKSGWIEQGMLVQVTNSSSGQTITLPFAMADTNYSIQLTAATYASSWTGEAMLRAAYETRTRTSFGFQGGQTNGNGYCFIEVKGFAA